ncbi:hypothetical protein LCGC14_0801660 [marine sediment metagenome]|uniref:Uncharacterized protein n=1 Tax=marine sediment metagenome TaxID=412755 RepID=A0A0F9SWI8_9ZZZZ
MCEFISWVEKGDKVYYLTYTQTHDTIKGKKLLKKYPGEGELVGHSAISDYYRLGNSGEKKECTDFSTPNNFPNVIVQAIKNDKLRGMGIAQQLLTGPVWAEYRKVAQSALAEYRKVEQSALAEYRKVEQSVWAEYRKVAQSALAEYRKAKQSALAEYRKVEQSAFWNSFTETANRNPAWL